ncbi:PAS domain S-box protein [Mucilaginibacter sp.]|jgi:PAS domain S-box-containing protein|uniref:PAS domain S-box protein n=1 Tax=Mucilaginibacter sp. TaxID=1882438 RepID=UPI002B85B0EB|nr:PAS domain S-box protein [Mucilaginibacter sp.]HTI58166.1 PAS domain S-box protein [Mucilaginibacter sp.]
MELQNDRSKPKQELEERDALIDTILRQQALINGTQDLIWSVDTELRIITANQSFAKNIKALTGRDIREGDDVLVKEFGHDRLNRWRQYYERALDGEEFLIKEDIYNPLKQAKQYSLISLSPMYDQSNNLFGIACYSKDITPDTLNLLALEHARARLEKIMDSSLDMICTIDERGTILSVSAACRTILGYEPEEIVGKPLFDFLYPQDLEKTERMAASVMAGNAMTNNENRYVRKDGSLVPLTWSARWDPRDKIRYGIARDATEKKKSENALKTSNERFEYVTKATSDIIWDWNLETNEVYYSDNIKNLFGHTPGYNRDNLPFYFEHVHPDDRERVVLYPDQVKYGTMINWMQEYRFRKANGEYAFVLDRGIVIRNEKGVGVRMIGAMQDISLMKEQELRVIHQNEQLMEIARINAHEIRRPVATILGLLHLFNQNAGSRSDGDRELLEHLGSATGELDDVIKRIIDKTVE